VDQISLTKEQAEAINAAATVNLGYLHRLRERMVKAGFPHDDRLLKLVENAYDATQRLFMALHYLSCDDVGNSSSKNIDDGPVAKQI
jgi:hypothetical protein